MARRLQSQLPTDGILNQPAAATPARAANLGADMPSRSNPRPGNVRWGLIAALLGLPLPIILIAFLFVGGCR